MNQRNQTLAQLSQRPPDYVPATFEDALYDENTQITIAIAPLVSGSILCIGAYSPVVATLEPFMSQLVFVPTESQFTE